MRERKILDEEGVAALHGFTSFANLLRAWYLAQRSPAAMIGKKLGISRVTVLQKLRKHDIPVRSRGGRNHSRWRKER